LLDIYGVRRGSLLVPNNEAQILPVAHEAGPSQLLTPTNNVFQNDSVSEEDKSKGEDVVSFNDIMDAANRAADAFEVSGMSRVSDLNARRRRQRYARLVELNRCKMALMFYDSSDTEYSSDSQVS